MIKSTFKILLMTLAAMTFADAASAQKELTFKVVDTDQVKFYNDNYEISAPASGESFYGQDANYNGNQPSYVDNGDGTVSDLVTGLMWQKSPDMDGDGDIDAEDKMSYEEAVAAVADYNLAGYDDWRLPTIKEMYSLIIFSGIDPSGYDGSSTDDLVPFINTDYFDFAYGDTEAGERLIDAQMASSTMYVGLTMGGDETMFGVNFADGRIKGYGIDPLPGQTEDKQFYVMYVRGEDYGVNDFIDNTNGTITDNATGLMWMKNDSNEGMNWEDALQYAEASTFADYTDWRLPNVKELQSIVDYTRSPSTTDSPAIDPLFNCTTITDEGGDDDYPFYWSGTTHANWTENEQGVFGSYVSFGEALGWMEDEFSGDYTLMDVHGAGAQRSDPKSGDPEEYPYGNGPQGDVVRIYNYVRLVRDANNATSVNDVEAGNENVNIYPNPASTQTTVYASDQIEKITVCEISGKVNLVANPNQKEYTLDLENIPSGIYFVEIVLEDGSTSGHKLIRK